MPQMSRELAAGPGWRSSDVVCTDGPDDPRSEEYHEGACLAVVREGCFQYRAAHGAALLVPGSVLLGNDGRSYECGHDHGKGDRCLCFSLSAEFLETIVAGLPSVKGTAFRTPRLPPSHELVPLLAESAAATETGDTEGLEGVAIRLAGYAASLQADLKPADVRATSSEEHAIAEVLRLIEAHATDLPDETLSLTAMSQRVGINPYRLIRLFRRVVGMTPHQYVLHLRLTHAAHRLLTTDEEISSIAFDTGFGDLSTFNHRFRSVLGAPPGLYRAQHA